MRLKDINEAFNRELNDLMEGRIPLPSGKISEKGVKAFNDELNKDIKSAYMDESLKSGYSLYKHYRKHVLKKNEKGNSKNRDKYDYMTKKDYYNYAVEIANKRATFVIDTSISEIEEADSIIDDFDISSSATLMIDYNMTNDMDGKPMIAIFNKPSRYSRFPEVCLVEKNTGNPITIYPLPGGRFRSLTTKFLSN